MECLFIDTGERDGARLVHVCVYCGFMAKSPHPPERVHRACASDRTMALGDWVAFWLKKAGIKPRKGCRCEERKRWLNIAGWHLVQKIKRVEANAQRARCWVHRRMVG
jgi:hypothetical protein